MKYLALQESLESAKYSLKTLGSLVQCEPDYGSGARAVTRSDANEPRYIRITDFGDDGIEEGHEYVTADPIEWDCLIEANDLLFARSGATVGKTYLHEDAGEPAIFAGYCIRFRFNESLALSRFIYWFTKTETYTRWTQAIQRPSGQPNINKEEFKSLQVPLPNITEQQYLVEQMDAARAERKAKLAEADALLAGMDGCVLDALGIPRNPPQRRIFAIRSGLTKGGRADPDFHSLRFQSIRRSIENGIYPARTVAELCGLIATGFAAGRQDQAFDYDLGVPHLRPLNLNIHGEISLEGTKFVPKISVEKSDYCQIGEVLFNNTNSTEMVGKSVAFNLEQDCACSNHMTRLRPREGIDPEYLAAVFNALRSLGYLGLLSTNFNNQAGITAATLGALKLPDPPPSVQNTIAAEARRRRDEARKLRAEAEQGWREAKAQFEAALLGESPL